MNLQIPVVGTWSKRHSARSDPPRMLIRDDFPGTLVWILGGSALGNIRLSLLAPDAPGQRHRTGARIAAPPQGREGSGYVSKSKEWPRQQWLPTTDGADGAESKSADQLAARSESSDDRMDRSMSRTSGRAACRGSARPAPRVNGSEMPRKSRGQRPNGLRAEASCT